MNCLVRLGNCFLRFALMYQPSCLLPCCQGKPGELANKLLSKPQKQFILSLGISIMYQFCSRLRDTRGGTPWASGGSWASPRRGSWPASSSSTSSSDDAQDSISPTESRNSRIHATSDKPLCVTVEIKNQK